MEWHSLIGQLKPENFEVIHLSFSSLPAKMCGKNSVTPAVACDTFTAVKVAVFFFEFCWYQDRVFDLCLADNDKS